MARRTSSAAVPGGAARALAVRYLEQWAAAPGPGGHPGDPGIPVLAELTGDGAPAAAAAVAAWARTAGRGPAHPGLHDGGLAGTLVGLRLGARFHPALGPVADRLGAHLGDRLPHYRTHDVAFPDYDLISGPAGTLLALSATGAETERLGPLAAHLALLCDDKELPRLRTGQYAHHPHLAWCHGRINTGMGHGVAGVAAALTAALRRGAPDAALAPALTRATRWLIRRAHDDDRCVRTWPGADLGTPPPRAAQPRQAWCYGTPGVAWALWDAADALGDTVAAEWAAAAFTTLAEHYDEGFHLFGDSAGDRLGLCHGATGVLAVADCFDRYAGLPAATALKERLVAHVTARLTTPPPADWPADLLNGLPGVLGALLTAGHRDAPRAWLACLGLR
ncbi:lanthionine synthetase LanC family protein [Streptomyces sp. NPDC047017]|uniref:lanthionine synthetase LanC family protein n=1 Tax=Streptomyces sp. NPDC047017 TaxID=3155024 RepID=UPI0033C1C8DE